MMGINSHKKLVLIYLLAITFNLTILYFYRSSKLVKNPKTQCNEKNTSKKTNNVCMFPLSAVLKHDKYPYIYDENKHNIT